jgi:hypothetical protein
MYIHIYNTYVYIYTYIFMYTCMYYKEGWMGGEIRGLKGLRGGGKELLSWNVGISWVSVYTYSNDDVYLEYYSGKGFHINYFVYMSYVKHVL